METGRIYAVAALVLGVVAAVGVALASPLALGSGAAAVITAAASLAANFWPVG